MKYVFFDTGSVPGAGASGVHITLQQFEIQENIFFQTHPHPTQPDKKSTYL